MRLNIAWSIKLVLAHISCKVGHIKANIYAISSDTHQLQFLKLHHFKLERI